VTKVAFPTDEHYPFQDEPARQVALKIIADFKPDLRVAGSDGLDFYTLSVFDKDPQRMKNANLQHEIESWKKGQREWKDASPDARIWYVAGNHEDRLRRHLWRHPELFDLEVLRLPNLLGFAEMGIPWNNDPMAHVELELHKKLILRHGGMVRQHSAYTAKAMLEKEKYARSVIHGHTHRGGTHMVTTRDEVVQAQEGFCLCKLDPEYTEHPNWQQGITLAEVDDNILSIDAIPFHRVGSCVVARWRGKEYSEKF